MSCVGCTILFMHVACVYTGTVIGLVRADDEDEVMYYIDPGTINANNFDVNETTGVISFERMLDREVFIDNNNKILAFYCSLSTFFRL